MRENKFTPEDFLPQGTDEENLKKDLEKIRAAGKTGSFQELVKASREADLKIILDRYDIIRDHKKTFEQKYQQNLKELKKDVESGDYELAAARFEGLYKTLQMILGNLKEAAEEAEILSKRYWAKETEYLRLKHPKKEK